MQSRDLNEELVAWDEWCELHASSNFDLFAQERGLDKNTCIELKKILSFGNDIWRFVAAENSKLHPFTREALTYEFENRFDFSSELGAGGMGVVWLADQKKPIQRQVAVKLIKDDLVSTKMRKRFAFEQQALASLSHPNIATVHEAGETKNGRSYFVMEYIPGESITDFCDRKKLDLRSRLELFLQVCEGVQHAHRKGLVHRDLKPGNLIVMEENDEPVAKIIDFGLVKDTARLFSESTMTHSNVVMGSPIWMSPEQARVFIEGDTVQVDTRTDVYSLGVILYQLLTNSTPIPTDFFRNAPPAKVFEAIRNQQPIYPSRRLAEQPEESKDWIESSSDSSYSRWVGSLKNDLDWVVLKAIEKEASRRYGSVSEFESDIRRFINGDPVTARPPGGFYHFRKLVRRNQVLATSIVIVALTLLIATGISTWYAIIANKAQRLAERRLRNSEQLTEIFSSGFEALSYRDVSVENTRLKAAMLKEMGIRMEAKMRTFLKDAPPSDLATLEYLWRNRYVSALLSAELIAEAIVQLDKVVERMEHNVESHDSRLIESRLTLVNCLISNQENERAKIVAENNFEIAKRFFAPSETLALRCEAAWVRATVNERTLEENLSLIDDLLNRMNAQVDVKTRLDLMSTAAWQAQLAEDLKAAADWFGRARELSQAVNGNSIRTFTLDSLYWDVIVKYEDGRNVDIDVLEQNLKEMSDFLGAKHSLVLRHQLLYAKTLLTRSRSPERAIAITKEAFEACLKEFGPDHIITCHARFSVLEVLRNSNRYNELFKISEPYLEHIKKYSGEESEYFRKASGYYVDSLLQTRQYQSVIVNGTRYGFPHKKALALIQLKRYSEASQVLNEMVESANPKTKKEFKNLLDPMLALAGLYYFQRDFLQAIDTFKKLEVYSAQVYPPEHSFRLSIQAHMIACYSESGDHEKACEVGKHCLEILLDEKKEISPMTRANLYGSCLQSLVVSSSKLKEYETAKQYAAQYFERQFSHEAVQPMDHVFKSYLGEFALNEGNLLEAEAFLLESLAAADVVEKHPRYQGKGAEIVRRRSSKSLARIYNEKGDKEKARRYELQSKK